MHGCVQQGNGETLEWARGPHFITLCLSLFGPTCDFFFYLRCPPPFLFVRLSLNGHVWPRACLQPLPCQLTRPRHGERASASCTAAVRSDWCSCFIALVLWHDFSLLPRRMNNAVKLLTHNLGGAPEDNIFYGAALPLIPPESGQWLHVDISWSAKHCGLFLLDEKKMYLPGDFLNREHQRANCH